MSALEVLRQIKQSRRTAGDAGAKKIVEWGNSDFINEVGIENLSRRELRNHLEARDLPVDGTRVELIDRLRISISDEELHKFAYTETVDTEARIQADIEERGSVYAVGSNAKGQLGVGDMESRPNFVVITQLRGIGVNFVATGEDMCYAVTDEHDVYVWGGGGVGKSGINKSLQKAENDKGIKIDTSNNYLEPQLVKDLSGEEVMTISVGLSHSMAVGKGGDVFVWGDGHSGQLGLGDLEPHPTVVINNSFPAIQLSSCGSNHSVVLTRAGRLYTWGHTLNGRLGIGSMERIGVPENEKYFAPLPKHIDTLEVVLQISCGADHTLAYGASGVWSWGNGSGGKLGLGDNNDRFDPCLIPGLKGKFVMQIVAGSWHSMALICYPPLLSGGWVYTWGSGYHGQLGQGPKTISLVPELIEYFLLTHLSVRYIAAGSHHCAAITKEGELYTWGSNHNNCLARKLEERDVNYSCVPGHCGGFGAIVNNIGRGLPRIVACGKEFTIVATYPYEGPNLDVAKKLMEEARVREEEEAAANRRNEDN